ncbi:hypothetical protein FA13DRAFT_1714408 [Coprinellus micaceus]|uniref:Uncharacterized protein n=1 Tax=Coprinellus micaceus TaxID=71717 RepID=A0A4Y7ST17_COPMI|nr:hypothetical protein FA13DRAFT_1714408 [Coprinellus micaceus]
MPVSLDKAQLVSFPEQMDEPLEDRRCVVRGYITEQGVEVRTSLANELWEVRHVTVSRLVHADTPGSSSPGVRAGFVALTHNLPPVAPNRVVPAYSTGSQAQPWIVDYTPVQSEIVLPASTYSTKALSNAEGHSGFPRFISPQRTRRCRSVDYPDSGP